MDYFPKLMIKRPQDLQHGEFVVCQDGMRAFAWYLAPLGQSPGHSPTPDFIDLETFTSTSLRSLSMKGPGQGYYFACFQGQLGFRYKIEDIQFGVAAQAGDLFIAGYSETRERTFIAITEPQSQRVYGYCFEDRNIGLPPQTDMIATIRKWELVLTDQDNEQVVWTRSP